MGSVNKAILIGNLGKDAELRYTSGGTPVASCRIATTERFNDREGNKKEDTQWHNIVIWGKTAEAIHTYLVKGKQVYVEGKLQTRKWQNKEGVDQHDRSARRSCGAARWWWRCRRRRWQRDGRRSSAGPAGIRRRVIEQRHGRRRRLLARRHAERRRYTLLTL
jgi:single-strand DNA-binding protein